MRPLIAALALSFCTPALALTEGQTPQMVERLKQTLDPAQIAAEYERHALPTWIDPRGNLVIRLESNLGKPAPTLAFVSRLEAKSPIFLHKDYRGDDLRLPKARLSTRAHPALQDFIGMDLVTTEGKTPLANVGVAESLAAIDYLLAHPEWKHGDLAFVFLKGDFDPSKLGADFAYSLEGGPRGEFLNESFNASTVQVTIFGQDVSPGYAQGLNAIPIAADYLKRLPPSLQPGNDQTGFIYPASLKADPGKATMTFHVRDFEKRGLAAREAKLREWAIGVQKSFPVAKLTLETLPSYQNLRLYLEKEPRVSRFAADAYRRVGLSPSRQTFRGEADAISLSSRGLPTAGLFTGIQNLHQGTEWLPVSSMARAADVILELSRLAGNR